MSFSSRSTAKKTRCVRSTSEEISGDIWNVINIFRKEDIADPSQANTLPIEGLDSECLILVDNQLGTILQAIISTLCSMTTGNAFAFHAKKLNDQIGFDHLTFKPINFEDDLNAPFFDNGNDMHVDTYKVPKAGVEQRWIAEDITIENTGGAGSTFTVRIAYGEIGSETVIATITTTTIAPAGTVNIPSLISTYQTLDEDEVVRVYVLNGTIGVTSEVKLGARFSNSFK